MRHRPRRPDPWYVSDECNPDTVLLIAEMSEVWHRQAEATEREGLELREYRERFTRPPRHRRSPRPLPGAWRDKVDEPLATSSPPRRHVWRARI
jgi:hypothetical protein